MRYERTTAISGRHEKLLELIQVGNHSTRSLADQLDVSKPTISRDIEFLRDRGYQIKAMRVDRRWAYRIIASLVCEDSSIAGGEDRK